MRQGGHPETPFWFVENFMSKSKWHTVWFQYIPIALNLAYNTNKLCRTLDYWSRDILSFDVSEKGLVIGFSPHFLYHFSRKMFLTLYYINRPNLIAWFPLQLEILDNICIATVCSPCCDIIYLKTNFIFLIKPCFYMARNLRQNLKI